MEYRELGRTGVKVSAICPGTMTWGERNTEAEGHAQTDYALDRGVNFFDVAGMYPSPPKAGTAGRTEEIIGRWFGVTMVSSAPVRDGIICFRQAVRSEIRTSGNPRRNVPRPRQIGI